MNTREEEGEMATACAASNLPCSPPLWGLQTLWMDDLHSVTLRVLSIVDSMGVSVESPQSLQWVATRHIRLIKHQNSPQDCHFLDWLFVEIYLILIGVSNIHS